MLFQVVSAAFDLMETYPDAWKEVAGSETVPTYGFEYAVGLEPVSSNIDRMIERFGRGVRELTGKWKDFLSADNIDYLIMSEKASVSLFERVVIEAFNKLYERILKFLPLLSCLLSSS